VSKTNPFSSRGNLLALAILAAIGSAGCAREEAGDVPAAAAGRFQIETLKADTVFPEIGQYKGKPLATPVQVARFAAR
jgi:hypothetical protein